jgi:PRTRC genetic system protein C
MTIDIRPIKRTFRYNGIALPDVPGLTPREVRDLYSAQYPELISAEVEAGDIRDGAQAFTFRKAVGVKGASPREGERRAALRRQVQEAGQGTDLGPARLGDALARRSWQAHYRAWSHLTTADARLSEGDAATVVMPSDLLAPLP